MTAFKNDMCQLYGIGVRDSFKGMPPKAYNQKVLKEIHRHYVTGLN